MANNIHPDVAGKRVQDYEVCVVGAGLAGSLTAALLVKLGFNVRLYEKRSDARRDESTGSGEFGTSASATKRSINLALSHRGMLGLRELGLLDAVMEHAIRMPCRVIHTVGSKGEEEVVKQAYGKPDQAIWSVGRETINNLLLDYISSQAAASSVSTACDLDQDSQAKMQIFFDHELVSMTKDGTCTFRKNSCVKSTRGRLFGSDVYEESIFTKKFDLVIGADGAYSGVRESMLKLGRVDFSRNYISHGYKELTLPAVVNVPVPGSSSEGTSEPDYALPNHEGLHIWPRGKFMLIALPNPDKSFTATLFAPYRGEDGFDSIDPEDEESVRKYFLKHFPDVVPHMPNLIEDFRANPVGSLVTIRVSPWDFGKTLLLGDAAHGVVPFYGQGMNAAFEDGYLLYQTIRKQLAGSTADDEQPRTEGRRNSVSGGEQGTSKNVLGEQEFMDCVHRFASERTPAANALADLCLEHYADMAANTASPLYLLVKRVEGLITSILPESVFLPMYSMVAFSSIPYHKAVERSARQDKYVRSIAGVAVAVAAVGASIGIWQLAELHRSK